MYDQLASVYDRFINWPARLERELPPLLEWLGPAQTADGRALRVADVACGTGGHALALAARGYEVVGFDIAAEALEVARARAAAAGLTMEFIEAGYGDLAVCGLPPFDVLISLGNSLPHLLTPHALRAAFADFGRVVAPGGRLLLGMRNLPRVIDNAERWQPPKPAVDPDGTEYLFDRFYDFTRGPLLDFNFVTYQRPAPDQAWRRTVDTTHLRAWPLVRLQALLRGWQEVQAAANLRGEPFDELTSGDLFLSARR